MWKYKTGPLNLPEFKKYLTVVSILYETSTWVYFWFTNGNILTAISWMKLVIKGICHNKFYSIFIHFWNLTAVTRYFRMLWSYFSTYTFFLIRIHSMQDWKTTTRHGITRKRNTKRLNHTGNLLRENLQLKATC